MSGASFQPDLACTECGAFGAYAFDGDALCLSCYQARGSCCAERDCGDGDPTPSSDAGRDRDATPSSRSDLAANTSSETAPGTVRSALASSPETLRVNPNCCYQACPRCSHLQKLRAFRARFPHDWRSRLRGLARIVGLARDSA